MRRPVDRVRPRKAGDADFLVGRIGHDVVWVITIACGRQLMGSFRSWLLEQVSREDDIGKIARIVERDSCLVDFDYRLILLHLRHEHQATPVQLADLADGRNEWQASSAGRRE